MHKIDNISFQVEMQENNTAISYEKQYATFIEYQFLPKVESLFDRWSAAYPKLKCTIEEITLHLNTETFDAQELQKKLLQQLTNQLAKINVIHPEETEHIKAEISLKPSIFDAFIYYLKTGILPDYISIKQLKEWLKIALKFSSKQIKIIQQNATSDFLFLKRLANVYHDKKYRNLIKIIGKQTIENKQEPFVKELLTILQKKLHVKITEAQIKKWCKQQKTTKNIIEISENVLTFLQEKEVIKILNNIEKEQFSLHIIQAFLQFESTSEIKVDFIKIMLKPKVKSKIEETQNPKTKQEIDKNKTEETLFNEEQKIKIEEEQKQKIAFLKQKQEKAKTAKSKSNLKEAERKKEQQIQQKEKDLQTKNVKIVTEKGGLVLLHPFIKELFKTMDLLTKEHKIKHTNKAVLVLHYLATGNQEVLDLELSLEKILLGIPLTKVITINEKLTENEKQQCNELLSAVITHWKIYKSNAINSLRAMFLQRFANVIQTQTKINIEIEKQAQDILLDKLPWGIGMIKLPWLNQLIYTKW